MSFNKLSGMAFFREEYDVQENDIRENDIQEKNINLMSILQNDNQKSGIKQNNAEQMTFSNDIQLKDIQNGAQNQKYTKQNTIQNAVTIDNKISSC